MWAYPDPLPDCVDARDYVAFYWNKMDSWFEEDEEVFVGPKDPYTRVDCLASSRHVRVEVNGVTVAETTRSVMMLETGLPHRYYIPREDVNADVLRPASASRARRTRARRASSTSKPAGRCSRTSRGRTPSRGRSRARWRATSASRRGKADTYVDGELEPKPKSRWD